MGVFSQRLSAANGNALPVIEALTIASAGMLTALQSAGAAARVIATPQTPPVQPAATPRVSPSTGSAGVSTDTLSAFTSLLEAPKAIDKGIVREAPVPDPNTTPVIPPPGSPGGDPNVQPK